MLIRGERYFEVGHLFEKYGKILISPAFAYSSRWRRKPWQGKLLLNLKTIILNNLQIIFFQLITTFTISKIIAGTDNPTQMMYVTRVGGEGTPLYKVYRYVPLQRVWFLSRFGLKTGIYFDNYGLKSGRVFGAGNIYESLQTYFSSQYVTGTTNW